jgi:hypothetical protein
VVPDVIWRERIAHPENVFAKGKNRINTTQEAMESNILVVTQQLLIIFLAQKMVPAPIRVNLEQCLVERAVQKMDRIAQQVFVLPKNARTTPH